MKDKNNLWVVVVIAIVVAVIASLITVNLTGNSIKVPSATSTTQTEVYTKAEVDAKLAGINISSGVVAIEKNGNYTSISGGGGIGDYVKCPTGKKVISGGCSSDSAPSTFILHAFQATKSNSYLSYNDAWQCFFYATKAGAFYYHVTAYCQ